MRQKIRKTCIVIAFLSLPVTFCYVSPVIVVEDAAKGIASGSLVVFAAVFVLSILTGRTFCGWLCPCGGGQELMTFVGGKPVRGTRANRVKYVVSACWLAAIALMAVRAGGYGRFDFFNHTEGGISLIVNGGSKAYPIYYIVLAAILALTLALGRRSFCRYFCWLAPLTIVGAKIHDRLGLPGIRPEPSGGGCTGCRKCDAACPMSLPVCAMAQGGDMRSSECILCGACADACPKDAIRFGRGSTQRKNHLPASTLALADGRVGCGEGT